MLNAHLTSVADGTDSVDADRLLLRIAEGDRKALECLYRQLSHGLYIYALSIVQNDQDAQDALQDCFLLIAQKASSYRSRGKARSWIYTILRHRCIEILRRRQKSAAVSERDCTLTDVTLQENAEERLLLTACLQTLSEEERQIVMLHAVSGFRHREIAAVLERPLSTVLSKYNRALKKLRTVLEEG